jgi:hypothetical protein
VSKSGLPTATPQLVTIQLTVDEAVVIEHLAAEALKFGQFFDDNADPAEGALCFEALKKIHFKVMRYFRHSHPKGG